MISTTEYLIHGVLSWCLTTTAFLGFMYYLKIRNFNKDGDRKENWRNLTPDLLSKQIEYHNLATYRALEVYLKCLLAIIGGIAFIATHKIENKEIVGMLLQTGGLLILVSTILFVVLTVVHQKSKIIRWQRGFQWYDPLLWNECWFVSLSVTVFWITNHLIIPRLISYL